MLSVLDALCALVFSALSAMGIGGGSLLMLYLTELRGMEQTAAQSVNLLCFFVSSFAAIPFYRRAGLLDGWKEPCVLALSGLLLALLGAWLAGRLPEEWIRRIFGGFLVLTSLWTLFSLRPEKKTRKE